MEAYLLDISGTGLQLRLPQAIPCGTPVKIDGNNTLLLGEISRCEPEAGAFIVGVQLSHTLSALAELELLNRALFGDAEPEVDAISESRISRR
jgi:hypothetical protein